MMGKVVVLFCFLFAGFSLNAQTPNVNNNSNPPACQLAHVMGGDISLSNVSGAVYTLKLMVYRDTTQFALPTANQIYVYTYDTIASAYMYDSAILVPQDTALSSAVISPYGTQVGYYSMPMYLPSGMYQFVYVSCCRNPNITNVLNAAVEDQVFHTEFAVSNDNIRCSSPCVILPPVAYFPLNKNASFNPVPSIADADSFVCNLITPLGTFISANSTSGFANVAGFTPPPAAAAGPFSMNSVTGEITWTPGSIGNFIQSFQINEYKSGQLVGSMVRDMEFMIVGTSGSDSLSFTPLSAYLSNPNPNYNYLIYTPGQPINFQINGNSSDTNANVSLNAYSEIFDMGNPAVFSQTGSGNSISGTLSWTPPVGFSKNEVVVFRLCGNMYNKDYTLMLRSSTPPPPPTGVSTVSTSGDNIIVYPVPANNALNVRTPVDEEFSLFVINELGQKFWGGKMKNELHLDVSTWPKGIYYMQFVNSDGKPVAKTIIIE